MKGREQLSLLSLLLLAVGCKGSHANDQAVSTSRTTLGTNLTSESRCGRPSNVPWVADGDSIGPLRLDASFEDVRSVCPGAKDSVDLLLRKYFLVIPGFEGRLWIRPKPAANYTPTSLEGPIGNVVIETAAVRTAEGHGVGTRLQALRARLGSMLLVVVENEGYLALPRKDPKTQYLFYVGGFNGDSVFGGWTNDTAAYSDSITGDAVVERVEVRLRPR